MCEKSGIANIHVHRLGLPALWFSKFDPYLYPGKAHGINQTCITVSRCVDCTLSYFPSSSSSLLVLNSSKPAPSLLHTTKANTDLLVGRFQKLLHLSLDIQYNDFSFTSAWWCRWVLFEESIVPGKQEVQMVWVRRKVSCVHIKLIRVNRWVKIYFQIILQWNFRLHINDKVLHVC